jgi:hypothetical protein
MGPRVRWSAVAVTVAASALPLRAEVQNHSWDFSLHFGGIFLSRDIGDDALTYAVRGSYNFTPYVGLEGSYTTVRSDDATDSSLDADLTLYGFDLLYHFKPDAPNVPYVLLGAGLLEAELDRSSGKAFRDSSFFWEGGGGVKIPINKRLGVRFDLRFQRYRLDSQDPSPAPLNGSIADERFINRVFTLGIGWHPETYTPKRRKVPPPPPPAEEEPAPKPEEAAEPESPPAQ